MIMFSQYEFDIALFCQTQLGREIPLIITTMDSLSGFLFVTVSSNESHGILKPYMNLPTLIDIFDIEM